MDYEFIAGIETWGAGGQMLDLVTLKNGQILMITEHAVVLYENRTAFESGADGRTLHPQAAIERPV
jgi:hypothetical protein